MLKYFREIKNRVILLLISCCSAAITSYFYKEILLSLIVQSSQILNINQNSQVPYFIFTDVTEIFAVYVQLTFFICSQVVLIFFCYHIFMFFSFALFVNEYRFAKKIYILFVFFWILSGVLSSNALIPLTWFFFLSFQDLITSNHYLNIHFEAKLVEYFNFYTYFYFVCFAYFQSMGGFFLVFFYTSTDLKIIRKYRKIYYFCFVTFSALLSPEFISQIILSIIFIVTYEIFILGFIYNKIIKNKNLITVTN